MSSLQTVPVEVLIDDLFMEMPIQSVVRLGCTNKLFAQVCADELFWKRRLQTDFNFSGAGTARVSGWKFIYRGLFNPKVYVWGETNDGRLGLVKFPKSHIHGVPFPTQLRIPGVRIVSMVAGGMSFHALDTEGNIYVWGTLDGTDRALNSDGFSQSGKTAKQPLRLEMPSPIKEISCGRLHSSALDSKDRVWTFTSWGRPFSINSGLLLRDSKPIQIECGWGFSCVLTKLGEVFVWWPLTGTMQEQITAKNTAMDEELHHFAKPLPDGVIPCSTWDLETDPTRLPPLPALPQISTTGDETTPQETKIIKIAALDARIIALTNVGHVLLFSGVVDETAVLRGRWKYLPNFSEVERVRNLAPFVPTDEAPGLKAPETMKITHISAHFLKFFAYSTGTSSVVLMGDTDTTEETEPHVNPALQDKSVISVFVGDYHNAALTSSGKLLTWGRYSAGALGLGDPTELVPGTPGGFATEQQRSEGLTRGRSPPGTDIPTEVRFDHARKTPRDRFCFSACASGWHTGALVIDLRPDAEDEGESEVEEEEEEQPFRPIRPLRPHRGGYGLPIQDPHQAAFGPMGGVFRVGFAGRGATRGRGM